nr:MAG TPA: hypothetical protein [Caudoviricetes sp.]DAV60094.1 MAG TPA: hypothetical protein [Caudoviricetes sp.]
MSKTLEDGFLDSLLNKLVYLEFSIKNYFIS